MPGAKLRDPGSQEIGKEIFGRSMHDASLALSDLDEGSMRSNNAWCPTLAWRRYAPSTVRHKADVRLQ